MDESTYLVLARRIKQYLCSEYVCLKEFRRGSDTAINMGFSGKINDGFSILAKCSLDLISVRNIADNQTMARRVHSLQVVGISGVGQCIVIDDLALRIFLKRQTDEGRTDKTGSARYKESFHSILRVGKPFEACSAIYG